MDRIRILSDVVVGNVLLRKGSILKAKFYPNVNNCKAHVGNEAVILYGADGFFERV